MWIWRGVFQWNLSVWLTRLSRTPRPSPLGREDLLRAKGVRLGVEVSEGLLLITSTSQQAWSSFNVLFPALITLWKKWAQKTEMSVDCTGSAWQDTRDQHIWDGRNIKETSLKALYLRCYSFFHCRNKLCWFIQIKGTETEQTAELCTSVSE